MGGMAAKFERPIGDFPEVTRVRVYFKRPRRFIADVTEAVETVDVEIPTAEIFVPGNWLARRFAATPAGKIVAALDARGIDRPGLERWLSVLSG